MTSTQTDLEYVKNAMQQADAPHRQPLIYALWGVIVLFGYTVAEFQPAWISGYWLAAAPLGFVASIWLGHRYSQRSGQVDSRTGRLYVAHFGILTMVIFIAMFSAQHMAILLIIGLGYCLAGIHLDRAMLAVGVLTILAYLAVVLGYINSNLVLGLVISAGLFTAAWSQRAR